MSDAARVWLELPWVAEHALRPAGAEEDLLPADHQRLSVLDALAPTERRAAARRLTLPSLAGAVYETLPDGRATEAFAGLGRGELYSAAVRDLAPLRSRFAYEICTAPPAGCEPWLVRARDEYGRTASTRSHAVVALGERVRKQQSRKQGRDDEDHQLSTQNNGAEKGT